MSKRSGIPTCSAFLALVASPSRTLRAAAESRSIRSSLSLSSSDSGVQSVTTGTSFNERKEDFKKDQLININKSYFGNVVMAEVFGVQALDPGPVDGG